MSDRDLLDLILRELREVKAKADRWEELRESMERAIGRRYLGLESQVENHERRISELERKAG